MILAHEKQVWLTMTRVDPNEETAERKQPPVELAEHTELAWAVLNALADSIILINSVGTIMYMNASASRRTNKRADALIGSSIWDLIPSEKVNHRKAVLNRVINTGLPIDFIERDGEQWNQVLLYPISGLNGKVANIAICVREITQQIKAEEELKRMTLQYITMQEDERRRISQDLHDDIGQSMTALILGLKAIDGAVTAGEKEIGQQIKDAIRSVEAIMKQVRQVFYQLHPPSLDVLPLAQALESFCHTFSQQTGLHVDFNSETLPPIPDLQATALYRLVQEGLNNAAKHARATSVWINLGYSEGEVSLSIEDNGQGFDPKRIGGSMGLRGIRERFLMLNGSFDIESAPGKGTRLFGSLPLAAPNG